jgi:S-DNA-T family DNA segregation ATPase FtsK/SpoIIIE
MATRRRTKRTRTKRASLTDTIVGWLAGAWAELTDDQRRDLTALVMIGAALAVIASMVIAPFAHVPLLLEVRSLTMTLVGVAWPLLVGGLVVSGVLLIYPSAAARVQRVQGVALAVAAVALLGLLALASSNAGGWLGQVLADALRQWLGAVGASLVLVSGLGVAVVFALRLRISQVPRALTATLGARLRQVLASTDQHVVEDGRPGSEGDDASAGAAAEGGQLVPVPAQKVASVPAQVAAGAGGRAVTGRDRWRVPSLSLLAPPHERTMRAEADIKAKVRKIEAKLLIFGIKARVTGVDDGPAITRYVLETPDDVPVRKVLALQQDLSLALAVDAASLRIEAPIPGRSAIGIEVPAARRETVGLRGVLEAEGFAPHSRALALGLGSDVAGEAVIADLATMPHLLMAGATGQGKSVGVNCLICSLLLQHTPLTLRLLLIDPKRVELAGYAGIPHLAGPVIVDAEKAAAGLRWGVGEMERRYKLLHREGTRNIAAYNQRVTTRGAAPMAHVVVVIDELADLMLKAAGEIEELVCRIAQMARAVGIHMVVATQRPSVDVVTGLIKANIPARISFKVSSRTDSDVILGAVGAEKLLGKGDMLYKPVDGELRRLQGAWLADAEVEALVAHWARQGRPEFFPELADLGMKDEDAAAARLNRNGGGAHT